MYKFTESLENLKMIAENFKKEMACPNRDEVDIIANHFDFFMREVTDILKEVNKCLKKL